MKNAADNNASHERLAGVVERITFHSPDTGWTVLKISPFDAPQSRVAVVVHQLQVFAGATMDFFGHWRVHPKYGEQFQARHAVERKPASLAALEKYLGSGLIRGVGPKTARKIVGFFGDRTLTVFDRDIDALMQVRGIADRKLATIRGAWLEHRSVRDVMIFLQEYGVSTLFAIKIYKAYGDEAIAVVKDNPYRLARDIYGIGFFSADRIALALGFERDSEARMEAGLKHVLAASRDEGHCFLTVEQVCSRTIALLAPADADDADGAPPTLDDSRIETTLGRLLDQGQVRRRLLPPSALATVNGGGTSAPPADPAQPAPPDGDAAQPIPCYYANSLFRDEDAVAKLVGRRADRTAPVDSERVQDWVIRYCQKSGLNLSDEQRQAVCGISGHSFSILTGGPGCGKTTATRVLVRLLQAMGKKLLLAAPTGRAAQRMTEVIGMEARTIHRLLEWDPRKAGFKRGPDNPVPCDFLVVDEVSMLDITLAASLLAAVPLTTQLLLIGDPHQLPSVGAGNVLRDLLACDRVPRFALTKIFRQAEASHIIRYAHSIHAGVTPSLASPLADPSVWDRGVDCLFFDAEEATQEQLRFIRRAKGLIDRTVQQSQDHLLTTHEGQITGKVTRNDAGALKVEHVGEAGGTAEAEAPQRSPESDPAQQEEMPAFVVPHKFRHVDLEALAQTRAGAEELAAVLQRIPAHSALRYGMSAADVVQRLYTKTLPEQLGSQTEIQVLTPMNRGSLGAHTLNTVLQQAVNPPAPGRVQLQIGERIFRVGDRVIQRRNNYDKRVFNGDIGRVVEADNQAMTCTVCFSSGGTGDNIVVYQRDDLIEISLAYAITIHKSQGSEFDAVVIPLAPQHFKMLFRNLIYTALTRAKKMAVLVGSRYALRLAVEKVDSHERQTALAHLLQAAG